MTQQELSNHFVGLTVNHEGELKNIDTTINGIMKLMQSDVQYSFTPDDDQILGVMGRYVYVEITGYADEENYTMEQSITSTLPGDSEVVTAVLRITLVEYQKLFRLWLLGKKRLCELHGHFCGVFGNFHIEDYKTIGEVELTRFDDTLDCDDPNFIYYESVPMIKVTKWDLTPDFEHG